MIGLLRLLRFDFENGKIIDKFVQLINPEKNISSMITRLTGITNKMVKSSPTEEMIIDDLAFLGNIPIVAHNISFDQKFLSSMCKRLGRDNPNLVKYDTLQLARSKYLVSATCF